MARGKDVFPECILGEGERIINVSQISPNDNEKRDPSHEAINKSYTFAIAAPCTRFYLFFFLMKHMKVSLWSKIYRNHYCTRLKSPVLQPMWSWPKAMKLASIAYFVAALFNTFMSPPDAALHSLLVLDPDIRGFSAALIHRCLKVLLGLAKAWFSPDQLSGSALSSHPAEELRSDAMGFSQVNQEEETRPSYSGSLFSVCGLRWSSKPTDTFIQNSRLQKTTFLFPCPSSLCLITVLLEKSLIQIWEFFRE